MDVLVVVVGRWNADRQAFTMSMEVKCFSTSLSASSSTVVVYPNARAFIATLNREGFEEPSASGGIAVFTDLIPSLIASRQHRGPSPVMQ